MSDEELKQLIASNAKAIQALSHSLTGLKDEWKKDRKQMYEWMSRLSASQANFWEIQADYYRRLEDVEDRQAKMLEILDRVNEKDS
jgi:uncharacterized coiled-coil protein SlyX